jgi:hypothetical protein
MSVGGFEGRLVPSFKDAVKSEPTDTVGFFMPRENAEHITNFREDQKKGAQFIMKFTDKAPPGPAPEIKAAAGKLELMSVKASATREKTRTLQKIGLLLMFTGVLAIIGLPMLIGASIAKSRARKNCCDRMAKMEKWIEKNGTDKFKAIFNNSFENGFLRQGGNAYNLLNDEMQKEGFSETETHLFMAYEHLAGEVRASFDDGEKGIKQRQKMMENARSQNS